MSRDKRSVAIKLRRARSNQSRALLLEGWLESWKGEQDRIIRRANECLSRGDMRDAKVALTGLSAVNDKKLTALSNIFAELLSHIPDTTKTQTDASAAEPDDTPPSVNKPISQMTKADKVLLQYEVLDDISAVADHLGMSKKTVARILYDAGEIPMPDTVRKARFLHAEGKTIAEIAKSLGMSEGHIREVLPYKRGAYDKQKE